VGGGNSAGQAARLPLRDRISRARVVRGPASRRAMSRYLIQRIESSRNIELRTRTRIESLEGGDRLERVRWSHVESGEPETRPIRNLFCMTGADPNTAWIQAAWSSTRRASSRPAPTSARTSWPKRSGRSRGGRISWRRASPGVRGGRRTLGEREAGRLRGGRGVDLRPAHPQGAPGSLEGASPLSRLTSLIFGAGYGAAVAPRCSKQRNSA